jgi:hypothetical protein
MINNVQEVNNCINIPSSQTSRSYLQMLFCLVPPDMVSVTLPGLCPPRKGASMGWILLSQLWEWWSVEDTYSLMRAHNHEEETFIFSMFWLWGEMESLIYMHCTQIWLRIKLRTLWMRVQDLSPRPPTPVTSLDKMAINQSICSVCDRCSSNSITPIFLIHKYIFILLDFQFMF